MTEIERMNAVDRFCDALRETLLRVVRTPDKRPPGALSRTLRRVAWFVARWHARHEQEWMDRNQPAIQEAWEHRGQPWPDIGPKFTLGRTWALNYLWRVHSIGRVTASGGFTQFSNPRKLTITKSTEPNSCPKKPR